MAKSIVRTEKGRGRGRPPTFAKSIHLTLTPPVLAAIDRFIVEEKRELSRPEAIRELLRDGLIGLGLLRDGRD